MRTPKFLYFDLGNVLLTFDHRLAATQIAELTRLPVEKIWAVIFDQGLQWRYESGEIDDDEFYEAFCKATGTDVGLPGLLIAASNIFQLNLPMVPLVAGLASAAYRMGILSNTCSAHWNFVSTGRYGLLKAFETRVLSYEVRHAKPKPEIFRAAADLVGFEPGEIFFVDDLPANIAGAREAGFDAELFVSAQQTAADLRQRALSFNF